jgi:hypothetical protein
VLLASFFMSFAPLKTDFFFAKTRDASGRLQRRGAVKGERSEFISDP